MRYNVVMRVKAYQTTLIKPGDDLTKIIAAAITDLPERSFLVVATKAFSTAESRLIPKSLNSRDEKHQLVRTEADWYLEPSASQYDLMLTIKRNWMFVNAGIDESNAEQSYVLWPADPQLSVNRLWSWARDHYQVSELGVLMTDSSSFPLNWGVVGRSIAYCGFEPLYSYIGKPDLFGRAMKMEQLNIMQSIAAAAVLEMGEGGERQPVAVVSQVKKAVFQDRVPTTAELAALHIEPVDDAYAPIMMAVEWKKGGPS